MYARGNKEFALSPSSPLILTDFSMHDFNEDAKYTFQVTAD